MNMENNTCEGGKCNGGGCDGCGSCHGNMMSHGCCGGKKCHLVKMIIRIVIIVIIFCVGIQIGELKSMMRSNNFGGRNMMWSYNSGPNWKSVKVDNGSATSTDTTKPAPKQ